MMPSHRNVLSGLALFFFLALPAAGWAGSVDALALENRLDDQWLDGDRDTEDLALIHIAPHAIAGRMPSTYVALEGFVTTRAAYGRGYGGLVVLQFPFERLGRHSAPAISWRGAAREDGVLPTETEAMPLPLHAAPFRLAADTAPAPAAPPSTRAGFVVLDMAVARACVTAALRSVGLADDARIDSIAARARSSAMLPELRLRAMRSVDESGRITLSEIDPSRYTETGGATDWIEARLTFRLDRLIFADDEVAVERIRIERSDQRARATARVVEALFEWQRAYLLARDPDLGTDEHVAAVLRELEAAARLDIMTDGWFGRFRAGLKVPPS
jgi:hypothetical protein